MLSEACRYRFYFSPLLSPPSHHSMKRENRGPARQRRRLPLVAGLARPILLRPIRIPWQSRILGSRLYKPPPPTHFSSSPLSFFLSLLTFFFDFVLEPQGHTHSLPSLLFVLESSSPPSHSHPRVPFTVHQVLVGGELLLAPTSWLRRPTSAPDIAPHPFVFLFGRRWSSRRKCVGLVDAGWIGSHCAIAKNVAASSYP